MTERQEVFESYAALRRHGSYASDLAGHPLAGERLTAPTQFHG
ncbi:hypothetical protein ACFWB0_03560 [Rhodococcus sp. NPDC060086]